MTSHYKSELNVCTKAIVRIERSIKPSLTYITEEIQVYFCTFNRHTSVPDRDKSVKLQDRKKRNE